MAGHYKDLTESGNCARKVSGTQGTLEVAHETVVVGSNWTVGDAIDSFIGYY